MKLLVLVFLLIALYLMSMRLKENNKQPLDNQIDKDKMVKSGNIYSITVFNQTKAVIRVIKLGFPEWSKSLPIMLIEVYADIFTDKPLAELLTTSLSKYWCLCSFFNQNNWQLIGYKEIEDVEQPLPKTVWGSYDHWVEDICQQLKLKLKPDAISYEIFRKCRTCSTTIYTGFARCKKCGTIREEFIGLEQFVTDHIGFCCLSGAETDVKSSEGKYYWAPYLWEIIYKTKKDIG